jgi:hypothetical protein
MVRAWLDSWVGVGHVVEAMHATGYNVRLVAFLLVGGVLSGPCEWRVRLNRDRMMPYTRLILDGNPSLGTRCDRHD